MKNAYVILVLLVCGLMGCKETTSQGPEDLLTVTKDKICLTYQKTETCVEGSSATYRLYLKDGKPVLESMQAEKAPGKPTYSQFNAAVALSSEKFTLTSDQRSIRLKDGERVYADSTGLGHLLMRDDKGKLWVMTGKNPKLDPRVYKWDPSRLTAAKPDRVTFESAKPLEMWMYLMAIHYQYGDAGNHYIPNDTGTEVVIIDNFHNFALLRRLV